MMKTVIEAATERDIGFIAELEKETFSMPQSVKELEKMLCSDTSILLVAKCGGENAGYIGAYTVCRESDIVTVAVAPRFRRCGIARALFGELFESLRENSDTLFLEVRESNSAARALYTSLGFTEIGVRKGYYKSPAENAVLYKKEL